MTRPLARPRLDLGKMLQQNAARMLQQTRPKPPQPLVASVTHEGTHTPATPGVAEDRAERAWASRGAGVQVAVSPPSPPQPTFRSFDEKRRFLLNDVPQSIKQNIAAKLATAGAQLATATGANDYVGTFTRRKATTHRSVHGRRATSRLAGRFAYHYPEEPRESRPDAGAPSR